MEIRVLGPVEVWHAGNQLRLPGRQHRLLLGLLALELNRLITFDRLVDLLWGERLPKRPRAVLHTRVSELRASLAPTLQHGSEVDLQTGDDGYMLAGAPEVVDANRFLTVVHGHTGMSEDEARAGMRQALGMWRGMALGGGVTDEAYRTFCIRLESARLTATEELFDLELKAGNHTGTVDEMVGAAVANPTRERLLVQAMQALQRTGRAAEALQMYDRARRWLAEELGVDPGRAAEQAHLALVRDESVPAASGSSLDRGSERPTRLPGRASGDRPMPREPARTQFEPARPKLLPPDLGDFAGREAEVAELTSQLTRWGSGIAMASVTGRGGIGKSALSIHVAHLLVPKFPDGQLYLNLRGLDSDGPVASADALGRFLRALGVDGGTLPERLGERVDLYRQLIADRRVLVVLDNAASDSQIAPLIPGARSCAVLINSRHRLGLSLGIQVLTLDVLATPEAINLVKQVAGSGTVDAEPDDLTSLIELCGHLPLALRVVGGHLGAKRHWSVDRLVRQLRDERTRLDY